MPESADTASVHIARPAAEVFSFMADPTKLSLWSFGTWQVNIDESGLIRGTSIKDGAEIFVRIEQHPALGLIDYLIGPADDTLQPRIFARVTPGQALNLADDTCVLTITALRSGGMDDDRWAGLKTTHAFEVGLIKSAIETGYDHREDRGG